MKHTLKIYADFRLPHHQIQTQSHSLCWNWIVGKSESRQNVRNMIQLSLIMWTKGKKKTFSKRIDKRRNKNQMHWKNVFDSNVETLNDQVVKMWPFVNTLHQSISIFCVDIFLSTTWQYIVSTKLYFRNRNLHCIA